MKMNPVIIMASAGCITYIISDIAELGNKERAIFVDYGSTMILNGEGEVEHVLTSEDKLESWVLVKNFTPKVFPVFDPTKTFDETIADQYKAWWKTLPNEPPFNYPPSTIDQTEEMIKKAFEAGWNACEKFYEI